VVDAAFPNYGALNEMFVGAMLFYAGAPLEGGAVWVMPEAALFVV
jgi:hypothetical protein